jgi:DNA replication protein DnaC
MIENLVEKKKCWWCANDSDGLSEHGYEQECKNCREERLRKIAEKIELEIKDRMKSIIPVHFQKIDTDRQEELKRYSNKSLFITGKCGTGKSVFLYSMAKEIIKSGKYVRIIRFPSWAMEMQASFKVDGENPFRNAQRIAGCSEPLFIDDLGAEKATEYIRQLIYFILDEREQKELRTVISSNFSLKEIDEQIDPRASSRIAGMCEVLIFKGNDRRIKKEG